MLVGVFAAGFSIAGFGFFNYQYHAENAIVGVYIIVFLNHVSIQVFFEQIVGEFNLVYLNNTTLGETGFLEITHKNLCFFGAGYTACNC